MLILLCYTSAFSEVIYADFCAKILDWNFRLLDNNSQILVIVYISKLNFSFSFPFVDENCRIFVIVVVFVTKINLFSSTKIFVLVVVDEKNWCECCNLPKQWYGLWTFLYRILAFVCESSEEIGVGESCINVFHCKLFVVAIASERG